MVVKEEKSHPMDRCAECDTLLSPTEILIKIQSLNRDINLCKTCAIILLEELKKINK